jgi:hypothetical protein
MTTSEKLCGCMKCHHVRYTDNIDYAATIGSMAPGHMIPGFRYACEICGNKRCPHHTDHLLPCTRSNEPGQPGSAFT